ncbi:glycoside hydrolase family 75 protein [Streptomyces sp. TRM68367]|uniref:glycoside hydrolase family 75 protein n=1 Tax=Streptomyces sp. TRM68367 TaxID=2758415 RepID=UPI00165C13E9|nr:glycoside hydrolase family 75 protein [Streptomyces sp. TRM68367]MBC9728338.1 glycoside hydrolase family 75 protein [Streptomyces sp. TRM68367]
MRIRPPALAAASAAALLAAAALPATASPAAPAEGSVGAAELLAKVRSCTRVSHGRYRTDANSSATVPVCGADGAVFWKADMDIDCDGQRTAKCNERTNPWFQDDTAFHRSDGRPLRSDTLPYVVVPAPSGIWDYAGAGIKGGGVVAVVYRGRVRYAVVGDAGPSQIIGEASYATAEALGIDPDPATGGTGSEVTYILFTGSRVSPIENHDAAVTLGDRLAREFVRGT